MSFDFDFETVRGQWYIGAVNISTESDIATLTMVFKKTLDDKMQKYIKLFSDKTTGGGIFYDSCVVNHLWELFTEYGVRPLCFGYNDRAAAELKNGLIKRFGERLTLFAKSETSQCMTEYLYRRNASRLFASANVPTKPKEPATNPCEFCKGQHYALSNIENHDGNEIIVDLLFDSGSNSLDVYGRINGVTVIDNGLRLKYCPNCGRKLEAQS
jgi:hypothetical protein